MLAVNAREPGFTSPASPYLSSSPQDKKKKTGLGWRDGLVGTGLATQDGFHPQYPQKSQ